MRVGFIKDLSHIEDSKYHSADDIKERKIRHDFPYLVLHKEKEGS